MAVFKWQADRVFDGAGFLAEGTVVVTDEAGTVADVLRPGEAGADIQKLNGILVPALINSHCHLELSHFKGQVPEGGGLVQFLLQVVSLRQHPLPAHQVQAAIAAAAAEMAANGIAAVGDICNTTDAIVAKCASGLRWRNFVEVLNFTAGTTGQRLAHNEAIVAAHLAAGLPGTVLTPHAPYSVTPDAFAALNQATAGQIISVHNQETNDEELLFQCGGGNFNQLYTLTRSAPLGNTGKSSLQSWLPHFTMGQTVLLVHNTFTTADDVRYAQAHARAYGLKLAWCLCPGANRYIENRLPPLDMLVAEGATLVLGTDSYSSNWQLSIAAEVRLLADAFPGQPLERLLAAATGNAAEVFGWDDLGALRRGRRCGLTLLHTDAAGVLTGTSERIVAAGIA